MSKVIAHSGTQGTGKTYSMHQQVIDMMRQFPDITIDTVSGTARRVSRMYQINRDSTGDAQLLIFTTMISEMLEKSRSSDLIICDRSIYDVIAYTVVGAKDLPLGEWMLEIVRKKKFYKTIYFHPMAENNYCFADGLRDPDPVFRAEIDRWLVKFYAEYDIPYIIWRGDR